MTPRTSSITRRLAMDEEDRAREADTVRVVRGEDGMWRVEGTERYFTGRIVRAESATSFVGREDENV